MTLLQKNYDKNGLFHIEIESVFSPSVSKGFLPVRVTIRNSLQMDRTWNLDFAYDASWGEMIYRSNFSIPVKAGEEVIQELLVPVPTSVSSSSGYRQMTVGASSGGLPTERQTNSYNYSIEWPGIGISKRLADRNLNQLNSETSSRGTGADRFGMVFQADDLPGDWRGYTCLDVLMITDLEWQNVPPSARLAVLEWVRLGGHLEFYSSQSPVEVLKKEDFLTEGKSGNSLPYGLGKVSARQWDGQNLKAKEIIGRYRSTPNLAKHLANNYQSDWPLYDDFGTKSFNAVLVVLLLIAFGIVVGPINLFVLAKPGQRHKLFFTTPIISLIASLLILALILLSDGVGGSGMRRVLANLEPGPDEKRLYVIQEQFSRTGVLLGSGFRISDSAFLSPVMIPASAWNRLDTSQSPIAAYSLNGNTYRGDWYQSRSEQGHYLKTVRPTRSRIEIQEEPSADGAIPPRLFSSLEFPLAEFYYRDKHGQCWKARTGNITGGQEISLEKVEQEELQTWWTDQTSSFSRPLRNQAKKLTNELDHFFAISDNEAAGFTDTLGTIRWKDDLAVIHGGVLPSGTGAPSPESEAEVAGDKTPEEDAN